MKNEKTSPFSSLCWEELLIIYEECTAAIISIDEHTNEHTAQSLMSFNQILVEEIQARITSFYRKDVLQ